MSEVIMNLFNNFEGETFNVIQRMVDVNSTHRDENVKVEMIVEAFGLVRQQMVNYSLALADALDATIAKHAEEKAKLEHEFGEQMDKLKRKCNQMNETLKKLKLDNRSKNTTNHQIENFLQYISDQIAKFFAGVPNDGEREQEQLVGDVVLLSDNETDDENVDNDENSADGDANNDGDDRGNAEEPQRTGITEQNDGEIEMVPENVDTENVQSSSTNEDATSANVKAPINVAVTYPMATATAPQHSIVSEPGAPKVAKKQQCFWCEESFFKESSLHNHMKSDHGYVLVKMAEPVKEDKENVQNDGNEPDQYVRTKTHKRKRNSAMTENNNDNENDVTAVQSKKAMLASESKRRSKTSL